MKKKDLSRHYLVWLDHKKAVIASMDPEGVVTTVEFESELESHPRFPGEGSDKTGLSGHTLDRARNLERKHQNQMNSFVKEIAGLLKNPDEIVVLGPGTARFDLVHELQQWKSLANIPIHSMAADKMKLNEITKAYQAYFSES